MNLILSILALAVGPALYGVCRNSAATRSLLDGFLFVSIAGIVIFHIVPDVVDIAGIGAIAFFALGVAFAFVVDGRPNISADQRHSWIVIVGALGLMLHATMDGIALLTGDYVSYAVMLHRIPVGMAIWWTLRPSLGSGIAIAALVLIAVATAAAYLLGEPIIVLMQASSIAYFQAFVAGTLLHVIVFSAGGQSRQRAEALFANRISSERIGIILGLLVLFLMPDAH